MFRISPENMPRMPCATNGCILPYLQKKGYCGQLLTGIDLAFKLFVPSVAC